MPEPQAAIDITGDLAAAAQHPRQLMQDARRAMGRTKLGGSAKPQGQTAGEAAKARGMATPPAADSPTTGDTGQHVADAMGSAWQGLNALRKNPLMQFVKLENPILPLYAATQGESPLDQGQQYWSALQWWGRSLNSFFDIGAQQKAAFNIEHDTSLEGAIARGVFQIGNDPVHEAAWNLMPYVLTMAAEWEPWLWVPSLAAAGPQDPSQIPAQLGGLFGRDLFHPQFEDPVWYARMGSYVFAAWLAAHGGAKPASKLVDYSRGLPGMDAFVGHLDNVLGAQRATRFISRAAGGKGTQTELRLPKPPDTPEPIELPDGTTVDPSNKQAYSYAQWWKDGMEPVEEGESIASPAPKPPKEPTYTKVPGVEVAPGEFAERRVPVASPGSKLLPTLAQKLGLPATAGPTQIQHRLWAMAENREISPNTADWILKNMQKIGPEIGMMGEIRYWHPGEAPFRDVLDSLFAITDGKLRGHANGAVRMANGFRADLRMGIHGYGNNLVEALVKGVFSHQRSGDYYGEQLIRSASKVLKTVGERRRVLDAIENPDLYPDLNPHEQWAVNYVRRIFAEIGDEARRAGFMKSQRQPNFVYRVPVRIKNLDKILKGIPEPIRNQVTNMNSGSPFGRVQQEHRAITLGAAGTESQRTLVAEAAYRTVHEANAARQRWRDHIEQQLRTAAENNPELAAIINDPVKLRALLHAEVPDYSTDIIESMREGMRYAKATHTHKVMETARRSWVKAEDGQWRPLAVMSREGIETVSKGDRGEFKKQYGRAHTENIHKRLGYKPVEGLSDYNNLIFHPRFAEPINLALKAGKDPDGVYKWLIRKPQQFARHTIMLNPLWHAMNMAGRFAWLTTMHPMGMSEMMLKSLGGGGLKGQELKDWWDAQTHEYLMHGGQPPHLNSDVTGQMGYQLSEHTGDMEVGEPLDFKAAVKGMFDPNTDTLGAIKGVDAWYQNTVNDWFWQQYFNFKTVAYMVEKKDALERGLSDGDARLLAVGRAERWGGMVSPDRWMYNPKIHDLSQTLMFAPNWWRTFPALFMNTYDRMGMRANPVMTRAWALNATKATIAMVVSKAMTDNALNWLMSGHWQFQNDQGYQQQITMDRFYPRDKDTGAHTVMENPIMRQPNDLEKALGISEAIERGEWKPEFAAQGATDVAIARQSPVAQMIEDASNIDLYRSFRQNAWTFVDPTRPTPFGSPMALAVAAGALTPFGFPAQAASEGQVSPDGTIGWGPFQGTQVPGWAMRAFNPNEPAAFGMQWLGVRGGYPQAVKSEGPGLSTQQSTRLHKAETDYNDYLNKQQQAVMGGSMTLAEWRTNYQAHAAAHANEIRGIVGGTSDYMNGAKGLLSRYEALYDDPAAKDANGDINWAVLRRKQDELQGQTDPATWRHMMDIKNKRQKDHPLLKAYEDTLTNYHNFQDTFARQNGGDGEQLRALIGDAARSPNYTAYERSHPMLARYQQAKRQWELTSRQGFAYGMFTDTMYVMRIVDPTFDRTRTAQAEAKDLEAIQKMEAEGSYVTPTGS